MTDLIEIEITSDADRHAVEAALWHREFRHASADDRRVGPTESAFTLAVGDAWVANPLHDLGIDESAPAVWRTLSRLTRLRSRIFELRHCPIGTTLCWKNVDVDAFRESLAASRECVQESDGSLVYEMPPADRERVLAYLQASIELERSLEPDRAVA